MVSNPQQTCVLLSLHTLCPDLSEQRTLLHNASHQWTSFNITTLAQSESRTKCQQPYTWREKKNFHVIINGTKRVLAKFYILQQSLFTDNSSATERVYRKREISYSSLFFELSHSLKTH